MECAECTTEHHDAVIALGNEIVPLVASFLLEGPPPERVVRVREALLRMHESMTIYARTHENFDLVPNEVFVAANLAGHRAKYRMRSATLLGELGGANALRVLEAALAEEPEGTLRLTIRHAIDSLWTP
jgi:hypothetical protein